MIFIYCTENEYKFLLYNSAAFQLYFGGLKIGVLDIETTGLNPEKSNLVLGGLAFLNSQNNSIILKQYFADNIFEEKEVLHIYIKEVEKLDVLITYNGKHFDLPYLSTRCKKKSLLIPEDCFPYNLDLYLLINGYSELRKFLPNLKQKTAENFMGLWCNRTDEISGAESVLLYYDYLATKDKNLRDIILLHNSDDICQLSKLLPIITKTDFHKGMYNLGFPVKNLYITKIEIQKKYLHVLGRQRKNIIDYAQYDSDKQPCSIFFDSKSCEFEIFVPVFRKDGLTFIDLKTFLIDFSLLKNYSACFEDFLVIQTQNEINYLVLNHFIKILLTDFSKTEEKNENTCKIRRSV